MDQNPVTFEAIAAARPTHPSARKMPRPESPTVKWVRVGYVDLADPHPDDIRLEDIAFGLSRIRRYDGMSIEPFTVAQHSLVCLALAKERGITDARLLLTILMHDAPEYLVGDNVRPMKMLVPALSDVEDVVWRVMARKFGLFEVMPPEVKEIDKLVAALEKRHLISPLAGDWGLPEAPDFSIGPWLGRPDGEMGIEFFTQAHKLFDQITQVPRA